MQDIIAVIIWNNFIVISYNILGEGLFNMKSILRKTGCTGCLTIILMLFSLSVGHARELTERDWMITVVDALGWSYGLPDEPQDPDYINILSGNRKFRYEAETVYAKETDYVSLMTFKNFGNFSGIGWLQGTKEPTDVHLSFNLPIAGEYHIKASVRLAEHIFNINGETTVAGADYLFTEVDLGLFRLTSGPQEIVVSLPPNGSIDYISLTAQNQETITPRNGWDPDKVLTWETVNTTLFQLMSLAEVFPVADERLIIEAESYPQAGVRIVDTPHLGRPENGKWLRVGPEMTSVRIPFGQINGGFYDLSMRVMGAKIKVAIDNGYETKIAAKDYLNNYTLPSIFLNGQEKYLILTVPPGGGVDQISFAGKAFTRDQEATLIGFDQRLSPVAKDLDNIATLLAAFGVER